MTHTFTGCREQGEAMSRVELIVEEMRDAALASKTPLTVGIGAALVEMADRLAEAARADLAEALAEPTEAEAGVAFRAVDTPYKYASQLFASRRAKHIKPKEPTK